MAIVGMRFEARIIASPAVRAVFLGSDLSAVAAPVLPTDQGVVSFGVCGGLAPELRAGDCIVASAIYDGERVWPTDRAWTQRLAALIPNAIVAPLLGVDAPVFEVAEKGRLFKRHGAVAVDMESHLAASLASVHGVPFVSVRVVLDDAHCKVVASAMAGRRADGSVSAAGVLAKLGARPGEIAPLVRLAARANSARSTLARLRPLLAAGLRRA
ncbi:MAG TPA: phosphorylase [Roseiarcus sp.]|nr:phosphorylase [Roseiarcus sp.]